MFFCVPARKKVESLIGMILNDSLGWCYVGGDGASGYAKFFWEALDEALDKARAQARQAFCGAVKALRDQGAYVSRWVEQRAFTSGLSLQANRWLPD